MIEFKDVNKKFGSVVALKDIRLKIGDGITLILGPNGSGKTTFLKLCIGLLKPDSGEISIYGFDPRSRWLDSRRIIASALDPPSYKPWLKGIDVLNYVRTLRGSDNDQLNEIVNVFRLNNFIDRYIGEYSSGMLKRLHLATAFLGYPRLIILDEPLINIDAEGLESLINCIRVRKDDVDFLIASHITLGLTDIVDNLCIFVDGNVVESGSIMDLADKYNAWYLCSKIDKSLLMEAIRLDKRRKIDITFGKNGMWLRLCKDSLGRVGRDRLRINERRYPDIDIIYFSVLKRRLRIN
jgi:ABC-2 type transport system ATP-binding protein